MTARTLGFAATAMSIGIAVLVLTNQDNGRMAQGGFVLELLATAFFVAAGVRGSRWWFCGPPLVVLFWVVVAHIPALWN